VAVPEFPEALSPRLGTPVPDSSIIIGMDMFPETVKVPTSLVLNAAGVNATVNVQGAFTGTCCAHPFRLVGTVKTEDEV
jgi:hypothetical protein